MIATSLPSLSDDDYKRLEASASGPFSSVSLAGYPMTTTMPPHEGHHRIPADCVAYGDEEYHLSRFLSKEQSDSPFIAHHDSVMRGSAVLARARSKTFAKRIANALNHHTPNAEGV